MTDMDPRTEEMIDILTEMVDDEDAAEAIRAHLMNEFIDSAVDVDKVMAAAKILIAEMKQDIDSLNENAELEDWERNELIAIDTYIIDRLEELN